MTAIAATRAYEIYFEHRPTYLYVYVRGDRITYENAREYWIDILALQHQRGYSRVLVDKDISRPLPVHDVVTLVSELAHSGCAGVKFAIADRYYNAERGRFEETVAANRGLYARICPTVAEAQAWLIGN